MNDVRNPYSHTHLRMSILLAVLRHLDSSSISYYYPLRIIIALLHYNIPANDCMRINSRLKSSAANLHYPDVKSFKYNF